MSAPHVIVIGAGSTGSATAHDLAQRGLRVTVLERGEYASFTTGRNHCLLHSGGRYCVKDQESAIECIDENLILRRIMPDALELNGGLFVALTEEDLAFKEKFIAGCEACHIPYRDIPVRQALQLEPYLNPNILAAVQVPDGVFEPFRFSLAFLATAKSNGAECHNFVEVQDLIHSGQSITGVKVLDHKTGKTEVLGADLVVNATGPWAERVAQMGGVEVPVSPTAGVMVTVGRRVNNLVINRLDKPSDGDIVVPQRGSSIIGTTSWTIVDPDHVEIPKDHIERMIQKGQELIPIINRSMTRGVGAAARPLIRKANADEREVSRTFECFDHKYDGVEGFVTISGGKTTTARGMAEKVSDVVCRKLGLETACRTKETRLLSYRLFYS